MVSHPVGPLVVKIAKQPGSREHRWAHLLGGPVDAAAAISAASPEPAIGPDFAALRAEVAALRDEIAGLRQIVEEMKGG
jgi:uncharacterized protein YceH (UPF0502 family)